MTESATPAHRLAASRMFLTAGDVDDLITLARDLPRGGRVVDIGAGAGTTALAILQTRRDVEVWTIDNDQQALNWARQVLLNYAMPTDHWHDEFAAAVDAARAWAKRSEAMRNVDLLLHDGDHSRGQVEADLRAWLPYLTKFKSRIWVHDYFAMAGAQETYPGVGEALDNLATEGRLGYVRDSAGVGWIGEPT